MEQSQDIAELAKALVAVQKVLRPAITDSTNPHFKSKYADLESVMTAIREPLASAGLAITQGMEPHPDGVVIVTQLVHDSGQWMRGKLLLRPQKNDPQGIGSCITYGRRYGAAAIVGLHQSDDDGEAASGRGEGKTTQLEGPRKIERPIAQPGHESGVNAALKLTGDDDPLLTEGERKKLFAMLKDIPTEAQRVFLAETWGLKSRSELRRSHLVPLVEWIKIQKGEAA